MVGLQCTCMQCTQCGWFTMNIYAVYTMWLVCNVHVCSVHNVVGLQCRCMQCTQCGWFTMNMYAWCTQWGWFTMNMYALYTMWLVYNEHVCSVHNVVGLQ